MERRYEYDGQGLRGGWIWLICVQCGLVFLLLRQAKSCTIRMELLLFLCVLQRLTDKVIRLFVYSNDRLNYLELCDWKKIK